MFDLRASVIRLPRREIPAIDCGHEANNISTNRPYAAGVEFSWSCCWRSNGRMAYDLTTRALPRPVGAWLAVGINISLFSTRMLLPFASLLAAILSYSR